MPRRSGVDYLTTVIETLGDQFKFVFETDPLYKRVVVLVANMRPDSDYKAYDTLKTRISTDPLLRDYFKFVDVRSDEKFLDDRPGKTDSGTADIPGHRVRRQTRDVAALVDETRGYAVSISSFHFNRLADYFMFAEDDFLLCPNGLVILQYIIGKAHRLTTEWSGIRVSFGLAGWILPNAKLEQLSAFLIKHQWRRPPDHLVTECLMGMHPDSKVNRGHHMAFRHNLLLHIGEESVLGHDDSAVSSHYPLCYQDLRAPPLWHGEAFQWDVCWDDDMSPCYYRAIEGKVSSVDDGHGHRLTEWLWLCPPTLYPQSLPPLSLAIVTAIRSWPAFWIGLLCCIASSFAASKLIRRRSKTRSMTCPNCTKAKNM